MKIQSSSLQMSASYSRVQEHRVSERLDAWAGSPSARPDAPRLSPEGLELQQQDPPVGATEAAAVDDAELPPQLKMIKNLIEHLTGRAIRLLKLDELRGDGGNTVAASPPGHERRETAAGETTRAPHGWGVEYQRSEYFHEVQTVEFKAEGSIRTSDGREFSFSAELRLYSEFTQISSHSLELGDGARRKKDPLVINYDAPAARLSTDTLSFDVDAGGTPESIRRLAPGSGFLALDGNGDGRVNDGSELFGTRSGDGFADLARHDGDGNGWIDENDAVYGQLRLWLMDAGDGRLLTLKQADVGAIFVGSVATPFRLGADPRDAGGELKSSGVFLKDSGGVGTAQQVDLYV